MSGATDGKAILKEMVDGLKGVTPGKWLTHYWFYGSCEGDVFAPTAKTVDKCHHIARCFAPKPEKKPLCDLQAIANERAAIAIVEPNARHIARCCPDNIRAVASYAATLQSERDAALERVAVLESEKAAAQADALEGASKLLRTIAGNMEASGVSQVVSDAYRGAANKISRRAAKFSAHKETAHD